MNPQVICASDYDKIDGRNAYHSLIKKLSLGQPQLPENEQMKIAATLWREDETGALVADQELAIHQVLDLMVLLSRTLVYFKDAYRQPLLHDPENPQIDRIGLQGGVMPISIALGETEEATFKELRAFENALGNLGELTGERLRVIYQLLKELEL